MKNLLTLAIVLLALWYGYRYLVQHDLDATGMAPDHPSTLMTTAPVPQTLSTTSSESFSCDGRTHCSQMRSCAEATYFIRNCPDTRMDGNGDGIPCERQFCN